jgi:GrpB-like predicted nucleotidyltransferase (UPF0157 family)
MDTKLDAADARFRAEAFRLRLREDMICLRVRHLRRGKPADGDLEGLVRVHREAMKSLDELRRRHASDSRAATPARNGLADSAVEVSPYDPAWQDRFEAEAAAIRGSLGPYAIAVHHVGSTSIPGMAAKPIVDMAVAADPRSLELSLPECIGAMRAAGYDYYGDWGHHGGHYFGKTAGALRVCAVQLHADGSEDLADLLGFRDAARADPSLVKDYSDTKLALASVLGRNRGLYVWFKGRWLNERLFGSADALAWATRILRAQYPTLAQLGFRGLMARLRPRFAGKGLHPMALRKQRKTAG